MDNSLEFPWGADVEYDELGHWKRINWTMTGPRLSAALSARASQAEGARHDAGQRVLLLSDLVTVDDGLIALSLMAGRDPAAAGDLALEALVTSEQPLDPALTATLQWGEQVQSTALTAGRAQFGGLQRHQARRGLRLTLERPTAG